MFKWGLDDEIVLWDRYGNWFLTLKFNPKVNKLIMTNEIVASIRKNFEPIDNWVLLADGPHWNKADIILL